MAKIHLTVEAMRNQKRLIKKVVRPPKRTKAICTKGPLQLEVLKFSKNSTKASLFEKLLLLKQNSKLINIAVESH
uniref:Uncharacterized protein n=1 Tax=Daphnia galeata TaxID=27404 RepID=A0A8J2REY8_9CRUS|nr:unnamed protein product [Daphnia galeata]